LIRIIKDNLLYLGISLVAGVVYYLTLAPSVIQIDSGELAAVQCTLGIAHPTGYPLFTLVGYLFQKIPLFHSKIYQLNFLSMIFCSAALGFWGKTIRLTLPSYSIVDKTVPKQKRQRHRKRKKASDNTARVQVPMLVDVASVASGGLLLAFSRTFWQQGTAVEVYSLHVFLIILTLYFTSRAFLSEDGRFRPWIPVAAVLALGFSNHMTTLLILPGIAYLFYKSKGINRKTVSSLLILTGIGMVIIFLFYLYLTVRASQNPVLNWGNPVSWKNIFRHISGKQYSVWLFSSAGSAGRNLGRFLRLFPGEFTWAGLILGMVGFFHSLKKGAGLTVFFIISFLTTVVYAINYDIHDLDSYFLLAYLIYAFWIVLGIRWCFMRFRKIQGSYIFGAILIFCVGYAAFNHYSDNDRSKCYIYEDYTKQALSSLPPDALLISYQWDYLISPAYYFQFVEGHRKDVAIVDKELLRRSWYFHQMEHNYPHVMKPVSREVEQFLNALKPFEEGGNFNPTLLDQRYSHLIARLIETHMDSRKVYIAPELIQQEFRRGELYLPEGHTIVPDLFFFRVVKDQDYSPLTASDASLRFPNRGNAYSDKIRHFVSSMFVWRMDYEIQHGRTDEARHLKTIFLKQFSISQLPQKLRNL
jgi:hypothetical protein